MIKNIEEMCGALRAVLEGHSIDELPEHDVLGFTDNIYAAISMLENVDALIEARDGYRDEAARLANQLATESARHWEMRRQKDEFGARILALESDKARLVAEKIRRDCR